MTFERCSSCTGHSVFQPEADLGLTVGSAASALFKAGSVILGVSA